MEMKKINRIYRESILHVNLLCESGPSSMNFYEISIYSNYILKFTIVSLSFNIVIAFGFHFHCAYTLKPFTRNVHVFKTYKAKETTQS